LNETPRFRCCARLRCVGLSAARCRAKARGPRNRPAPFTRAEAEPWHQAFRQGLRELGWTEGDKVRFEYRYADGHDERLPDLAADLVRLTPDVIVVTVNSDAAPAMKATKTIPIVMAGPGDPVETGLIASLAHPGGNLTGLTNIDTNLAAKRLQLLKEVAPGISRVAVLWDPRIAFSARAWREIQDPARQLGISLRSLELHSNSEVDAALARAAEAQVDGLFALQGPIFVVNEKRIADFAVKHRLPSVSHLPEFVRHGGLMSYGADRADLFRRAATYVDKVLKGARPADLPVEQASKFQLVVNLKTAKELGLAVPQSILTRADEVIE
jgi:putative tryptophan/tyrosine transport system substrate-binding protein